MVGRVSTPTIKRLKSYGAKLAQNNNSRGGEGLSRRLKFGSVQRKQRAVDGALLYNGLEELDHDSQVH